MPTIREKLSTYAITISTFQQHRQRTANAELFITTLFQHRDKARFQLHGFVVMPDHTHILITPAINESTAKCIQYIKGGYSFAARQQCAGEIWHSGYHEHRIRDADDYNTPACLYRKQPRAQAIRRLSCPYSLTALILVIAVASRLQPGKIAKTSAKSHVKPQSPEIPRHKTNNQRDIKDLQPKNKSVKGGILVSLNSIQ